MANRPKPENSISLVQVSPWLLTALVIILSFIAWGFSYSWKVLPFNAYLVFPLFGLMAWSVMWSQYISGFFRSYLGLDQHMLSKYYQLTGYLVLVLICLHPGLLILQRYRDGFGLPPGSYESYVAPGLGWVTLLGTASFFVFWALELRRWFGQKPWWHIVPKLGDLAMLAIFYHSLRLSTTFPVEKWFVYIWWFYGLTLTAILINRYYSLLFKKAM